MSSHTTGPRTDPDSDATVLRRKYNRPAVRRGHPSSTITPQASIVSEHEDTLVSQGFTELVDHRPQSREGEHPRKSLGRKILRSGLLIDKKAVSFVFRFISLLNLVSLTASAPFWRCIDTIHRNPGEEESFYNCYVHFAVIASIDAVLAVLFTVHLTLRVFYELWWKLEESPAIIQITYSSSSASYFTTSKYIRIGRIVVLALVTISLWWSAAIGIYRSVEAIDRREDPLHVIVQAYYFPFVLRSLSLLSAIQFIFDFSVSGSGLFYAIKWKQLFSVIVFYLFFVYLYALVAVQWIGGLNERCVYEGNSEPLLALPATHCVMKDLEETILNSKAFFVKSCYDNPHLTCAQFPNDSTPLNIDFRNTLQLGQFRTIFDAFFAVYEASSLELWTIMLYTAFEGASRDIWIIGFYYASMVFFLVIFVQQSIFLVVIIESFADLRGNMSLKKVPLLSKKREETITVLEGDQHHLHMPVKYKRESAEFKSKLALYYYRVIERFFIVVVLIDAVLTATKFSGIGITHAKVLKYWQWSVSSLFFLEICGVFVFHLYHVQLKSFFTKYFIYLTVFAVGGLATAVLYDPTMPANKFYLALFPFFQVMRLPRALRLMPPLKRFLFKILGDGTQLLLVILMTLIFLVWISVITMQLFGYIDSECDQISGQFDGILMALQSTFQVVMGEGWNDLMSETMCQNKFWIPIMIYFVLLHLFASLILLNFFVAVILDNLEYPEEKKQKKLEQEQQQFKKKEVWYHLRVFKLFKAKTLAAPKLTSSEDNPKITESDVRRFFESGENHPANDIASYVPYTVSPRSKRDSTTSSIRHKTSSLLSGDITSLSLLSEDSSQFLSDDNAAAKTDVYGGIQSMLEYVKEVRKHNQDCENTSKGSLKRGVSRVSPDGHSNAGESEYDEYREKYHLFDSALFCMPPKHPVRKACTFILNCRIDPPKGGLQPVLATKPNQLCNIALKRAIYIARFLLSPLPCFTWLMLLIAFVTIFLMGFEYSRSITSTAANPSYIWVGDLIFIVFTLTELVIKILSRGVFFNPNAAIKSLWDVLDWIIVLATITAMAIYMSTCGTRLMINITLINLNRGVQVVLFLRALRPLRLISLVDSMRRVVWDVLLGWKKFLYGGILSLMFIFMFASFSVQLFASQNPEDSVLGFCNDRSITSFEDCIGEFDINVHLSREFLPTPEILENAPYFLVPRVWYTQRRDFQFDTTPQAFLTLFELLSLEGWLDVRDVLNDPAEEKTWLLSIYLHTYVFLGVNIVLQLFVGIVVNNFNEHKPDHSALLSGLRGNSHSITFYLLSQKKWTDLMQSISLRRPIKMPREPDNKFRKWIYLLVVGKYYQHFVTLLIVLHSFTFSLPWAGEEHRFLIPLSMVFTSCYVIELFLKLIAFGMVGYFHSWRNVFDFILVAYSLVYIICAAIHLAVDQLLNPERITDLGLVLAVLKFFTILGKTSTLQDLTLTIVQTFLKGLPLLGVLIAIMCTYSFLGCVLFSGLRTGEDINYSFINFESTLRSFQLTLRILTGEDWHHLLRDAMVDEPYCSASSGKCGNTAVAIIWFYSYYVIVTFVFINVIIAVLLENFTVFYSKGDTSVDDKVVADFRQNWYYFDRRAIGSIPPSKIKLFLRMLHLKDLYTHRFTPSGHKERISSNILTDSLLLREMTEELKRLKISNAASVNNTDTATSGDRKDGHSFQNVLKMLAYRAEDIQIRLEPRELYERIEIEESVQYEVAEKCILKWMQTIVKPVAGKLRQKLRMQHTHTVKLKKRHPHFERVVLDSVPKQTERDQWMTFLSDSEDDDEATPVLSHRAPLLSVSFEDEASEARIASANMDDDDFANSTHALEQSYAKLSANTKRHHLASSAALHSCSVEDEPRDKWHDWIKMQKDWMNHLDNDEYFDDEL